MTIIQKAVVCALGTGNVLFSGTKEPVKIAAFKGNHKKELKHFKGRSLCTGFLACEFTGILSDIAFGQEFADLKINNCLDKTNIYCAAGILIFYTLGYHKIGHSFRCMNGFWSILLYQRQVPFLCNALNHMFCQDLYMSTL